MRARPHRPLGSSRLRVVLALALAAGAAASGGACGLSLAGLGPIPGSDASLVDGAPPPGSTSNADGAVEAGSGVPPLDGASPDDASMPADASKDGAPGVDAAPTCTPFDAGVNGVLALSAFVLTTNASNNENGDGRITLTNSQNNLAGAAWYPTPMPGVSGYDLTWSFRVGPGDTQGDGITFAVLTAASVPGVGDDGDGIGLRNITLAPPAGGGGVLAGYAVDIDMFQNSADPTDLGPQTLKLVTMPGFTPVAEVAIGTALNDGNVYAVDVSWRAPSTLTATLHAPGGGLVKLTSSASGLTATTPYFGFTAATGGQSDSHNEIAGITVSDTCE